jgi:hypothetical protein
LIGLERRGTFATSAARTRAPLVGIPTLSVTSTPDLKDAPMHSRVRYLIVAALAAMMFLPAAATAATSFNGADSSTDDNSGHQIRTCDKESDSEQVHADGKFTNGTSWGVMARDADGNNRQCATSAYTSRVLSQHRTCEERDWAPDECGNWRGTGY